MVKNEWSGMTGQKCARAQTRLSDFSEYRTKDDMQLTELGTIKAREKERERWERERKRRGGRKRERWRESSQCR
jgi:hypothetical protein